MLEEAVKFSWFALQNARHQIGRPVNGDTIQIGELILRQLREHVAVGVAQLGDGAVTALSLAANPGLQAECNARRTNDEAPLVQIYPNVRQAAQIGARARQILDSEDQPRVACCAALLHHQPLAADAGSASLVEVKHQRFGLLALLWKQAGAVVALMQRAQCRPQAVV